MPKEGFIIITMDGDEIKKLMRVYHDVYCPSCDNNLSGKCKECKDCIGRVDTHKPLHYRSKYENR